MSINWTSVQKKRYPPINDTGISDDILMWCPELDNWLVGIYVKEDIYDNLEPGWYDEWNERHRVTHWSEVQNPKAKDVVE